MYGQSGKSERQFVYPIVRTYRQKHHVVSFNESKQHSVASINPETPNLFAFWFELFRVQGGMKRIVSE